MEGGRRLGDLGIVRNPRIITIYTGITGIIVLTLQRRIYAAYYPRTYAAGCLMNITNNILVLCALLPFLFRPPPPTLYLAASLTARNAPNRSYMLIQCRVYIRRLFLTIHPSVPASRLSIRLDTQKFQVCRFLCAASGKSFVSVSSSVSLSFTPSLV